MRKLFFFSTVAAFSMSMAIGGHPARAAEVVYPYCATPTWSEGLECDFRTREECLAVNAGLNRTCVVNPNFNGQQAQFPPVTRKRVR